jgi:acylphosphatase
MVAVCKRFYVAGRVQGVFFRASAADEARRLGLKGWVANLPDGRVEVLAYGDADNIDALERWLKTGPPMARVKRVEGRVETSDEFFAALEDFRIR